MASEAVLEKQIIDFSVPNPVATSQLSLPLFQGAGYREDFKTWSLLSNGGFLKFNLSLAQVISVDFTLNLAAALVDGKANNPISIAVNGNPFVTGYDDKFPNFQPQTWTIPANLLKAGNNEIVVSLDRSASTQLFINATTVVGAPVSIGPKEFKPDAGSPFLLSKSEFLAVQTYVEAGKQLPATNDDLQLKLGIAKEEVGEFSDLIRAYSQIVTHCKYFSDTTFPASVGLASDIVHYNLKVPIYYGALSPIIEAWQNDTLAPDKARVKLDAILKNLCASAVSYQDNARTVKEKMHQFLEETKADKSTLTPIKVRYEEKYTGEAGLITTYMEQAENARKQIQHWNDQYEHDVTVAATSPTYAWIWPIGTIAAAVVAGVYGKRASDDLDQVHEYQQKLATAQGELLKALNLNHDLTLANDSLDEILSKLEMALPVLGKMEATWGALADDLTNILSVIDKGIDKADAMIKDLGVTNAIQAWDETAKIADAYRANAYIIVKSEEEIKANPDKYKLPEAAVV